MINQAIEKQFYKPQENHSSNQPTMKMSAKPEDTYFEMFWVMGMTTSALCFLIQIVLLFLKRRNRTISEMIMTQIIFTRTVVSICEFYVVYIENKTTLLFDIVLTFYFKSDFALVCLMLIFTQILYDKIVNLSDRQVNLVYVTVIISVVSMIYGVIGICILKYLPYFFHMYVKLIFISSKFTVVTYTFVIYCRLLFVIFRRIRERDVHVTEGSKTTVLVFLLVLLICVQTAVTDLTVYFKDVPYTIIKTACVINSFQAVLLIIVHKILAKTVKQKELYLNGFCKRNQYDITGWHKRLHLEPIGVVSESGSGTVNMVSAGVAGVAGGKRGPSITIAVYNPINQVIREIQIPLA